jgi:hypothetical protein
MTFQVVKTLLLNCAVYAVTQVKVGVVYLPPQTGIRYSTAGNLLIGSVAH